MLRELEEAARTLPAPRVVLFDWHATLVDTLDAMYHAVDDVLPRLPELGLMEKLVPADLCKTPEDARLVDYVREHRRLHPKIKADRRISRTDIFEVLFGADEDAKHTAHEAFNEAYRHHYGEVHPFEGGELELLTEMYELDVHLGILTNRDREFFEHEFAVVDGGAWLELFDVTICGGDTYRRKPNPEPVLKALDELDAEPGRTAGTWATAPPTSSPPSARASPRCSSTARAGSTSGSTRSSRAPKPIPISPMRSSTASGNSAGWWRNASTSVIPGTPNPRSRPHRTPRRNRPGLRVQRIQLPSRHRLTL